MVSNTAATADSTETEMSNAWTWLELSDRTTRQVEAVRDALRDVVPADWTEETDPHISVLPGFEVPEANMNATLTRCAEIGEDLTDKPFGVDGFHVYNSLDSDDPTFVISLDISIGVQSSIVDQTEWVELNDGELLYDPVNPHITLFKQGDGGDDNDGLTTEQAEAVEARLDELSEMATFVGVTGAFNAERF